MRGVFTATGGARIGWINATFPLASLTATSESLKLAVFFLGNYSFAPGQVVAITRYTMIPVLGWGIKIQHTVSSYPESIIFWCLGSPDKLLRGIQDAGFLPQADIQDAAAKRGVPLRWTAIVALILLWNGFFYLLPLALPDSQFIPTIFVVFALGALVAIRQVAWIQNLVLRPGRSIGEIRPLLNLALCIFGIMTPIFLIISLNGAWIHQGGGWSYKASTH